MAENNIFLVKRYIDLIHYYNGLSTNELMNEFNNELKRICKDKKDEEVTTQDIEVAYSILCILAEKEE